MCTNSCLGLVSALSVTSFCVLYKCTSAHHEGAILITSGGLTRITSPLKVLQELFEHERAQEHDHVMYELHKAGQHEHATMLAPHRLPHNTLQDMEW
jgi:hypothetical protein